LVKLEALGDHVLVLCALPRSFNKHLGRTQYTGDFLVSAKLIEGCTRGGQVLLSQSSLTLLNFAELPPDLLILHMGRVMADSATMAAATAAAKKQQQQLAAAADASIAAESDRSVSSGVLQGTGGRGGDLDVEMGSAAAAAPPGSGGKPGAPKLQHAAGALPPLPLALAGSGRSSTGHSTPTAQRSPRVPSVRPAQVKFNLSRKGSPFSQGIVDELDEDYEDDEEDEEEEEGEDDGETGDDEGGMGVPASLTAPVNGHRSRAVIAAGGNRSRLQFSNSHGGMANGGAQPERARTRGRHAARAVADAAGYEGEGNVVEGGGEEGRAAKPSGVVSADGHHLYTVMDARLAPRLALLEDPKADRVLVRSACVRAYAGRQALPSTGRCIPVLEASRYLLLNVLCRGQVEFCQNHVEF
jgi:hypothetical protein